MHRLLQAPNAVLAMLWVHELRQHGIASSMLREYLSGAAGQLPPDQCGPEIWIEDAARADEARGIIEGLERLPQHAWTCRCGERVEGGFERCWRCGEAMPGCTAAG